MNEKTWDAVQRSAGRLDIEPAILMAVIDIESAGKIFAIIDGKAEPIIRFEGHYFDKRLIGSIRVRARLRGLASPVVGGVANPSKQKDRWLLLEKAKRLDYQAALESTSWGIGQVMGAHWKWLGYESVDQMVEVARSGIDGQIQLIERYIEKSGLLEPLRARDWKAFAKGYNGPAYAKFGYHIKLSEAYARLRDTSVQSNTHEPITKGNEILSLGVSGFAVTDLQHQLTANGYPVTASGIFDRTTDAALKSFQRDNDLKVDGLFGRNTADALLKKIPTRSHWALLAKVLKWLVFRVAKPI